MPASPITHRRAVSSLPSRSAGRCPGRRRSPSWIVPARQPPRPGLLARTGAERRPLVAPSVPSQSDPRAARGRRRARRSSAAIAAVPPPVSPCRWWPPRPRRARPRPRRPRRCRPRPPPAGWPGSWSTARTWRRSFDGIAYAGRRAHPGRGPRLRRRRRRRRQRDQRDGLDRPAGQPRHLRRRRDRRVVRRRAGQAVADRPGGGAGPGGLRTGGRRPAGPAAGAARPVRPLLRQVAVRRLQQRLRPVVRDPRAGPGRRRAGRPRSTYLAGSECDAGGFPLDFEKPTCTPDTDATAVVAQALAAPRARPRPPGARSTGCSTSRGRTARSAAAPAPRAPNANSTGVAAQALSAAGRTTAAAGRRSRS